MCMNKFPKDIIRAGDEIGEGDDKKTGGILSTPVLIRKPASDLARNFGDERAREGEFILVDLMPHPAIDALGDISA